MEIAANDNRQFVFRLQIFAGIGKELSNLDPFSKISRLLSSFAPVWGSEAHLVDLDPGSEGASVHASQPT